MTDFKQNPADPGARRGRGVLDPGWEDELRSGQEAEGEAGSVEDELAYLHLLRHAREPEALAPDQLDAIWSAIEADVSPEAAAVAWWRKAWIWWSAPAIAAAAVLVVVLVKPQADEATVARKDEAPAAERQRAASTPTASEASLGQADAPGGAMPPPAEGAPMADGDAEFAAEEEAQAVEEEKAATDEAFGRGGGGIAAATTNKDKAASPFEASFAKLAPNGRLAIRAGVDTSRDELRSQLLAKARGGG